MEIKAIKTGIFKEGEDLVAFILKHVKKVPEKSVLVVTSKIVALSEGRTAKYASKAQKEQLIKQESDFAVATKLVWMTVKDGMVLASAGIDESNANGKLILLPKDSFKAAGYVRQALKKKFKLKKLGVLITDSRLVPFRKGAAGIALGYAGFEGLKNYIGKKDIFGRVLEMSQVDVADSLATAAVLLMGEGDERQPLAIIENPPVIFRDKINKKELIINPKNDIYAPIFNKFN